MNFVSWSFVVLFMVVMAGRLLFGRRKTGAAFIWFTIVSSTIFVMWHVPAYIAIMLATITIDYSAARILDAAPRAWRWRKVVLGASIAGNLLLLGFFKYSDFALASAERLLNLSGHPVQLPRLGLILPIGISFYTFGSMSYTIDVYRGRLKAIRNFRDFYYFVAFFPHLVAGPIIRAGQFFYQFTRPRRLRLVVFNRAAYLIIRGVFLKMVCADNIARVVNIYWNDAGTRKCIETPLAGAGYSGNLILLALLFSAQIFCDFEGYTSIARGLAYLMGYRFPVNFRWPYVATSFSDFWQRWHITLSTWLRDYLYVPLCGNLRRRIPISRAYVSLFAVMLLAGLWHGAAITFICWGAIHGVALVLERVLRMDSPDRHAGPRIGWFFLVQIVALLALIFFRSQSMAAALGFIHNIADMSFGPINAEIAIACLFLIPPLAMHLNGFLEERAIVPSMTRYAQAGLAALMFFGILTAHGASTEFLYFQF